MNNTPVIKGLFEDGARPQQHQVTSEVKQEVEEALKTVIETREENIRAKELKELYGKQMDTQGFVPGMPNTGDNDILATPKEKLSYQPRPYQGYLKSTPKMG